MPEMIIDEFAMATVEGRKPRLTAKMIKQVIDLIHKQGK